MIALQIVKLNVGPPETRVFITVSSNLDLNAFCTHLKDQNINIFVLCRCIQMKPTKYLKHIVPFWKSISI